MKRQNVRTLSLVVCTFTYLLIGAAVFDFLESEAEVKRWEVLVETKNRLMRQYNMTETDYEIVKTVLIESKPHKAGPQWKFAGAFYFSVVVIALIGYGHSTPVTVTGKAFCMIYAVIGIPLGIVMFQSIGERLNKVFAISISKIKTIIRCSGRDATEVELLGINGALLSFMVLGGAYVFSKNEAWTYADALYYCVVTLTTIGFGDLVTLQNDNALMTRPGYVAFCLFFILFGLAVINGSTNLLILRFMTMTPDEEDELGPASRGVMTFDGELSSLNGKLGISAMNYELYYEADQVSVCSCTCYGNSKSGITSILSPTKIVMPSPRPSLRNQRIQNTPKSKKKPFRFLRWKQRNIQREGSLLSKLTFGIDTVTLWGSSPPRPPKNLAVQNTSEFITKKILMKRASI
ncbi:two pore potassium channel protein sup-9-like [Artemia franciscana]|uniref:Potassium channel domain-containing protein n=1 Tax=Artemia franciscana TaxID=6661 RepID=A0AA88HEA0_ARTSF|nr:hypothetical protein QYM36_015233 [Artemia franciscana]